MKVGLWSIFRLFMRSKYYFEHTTAAPRQLANFVWIDGQVKELLHPLINVYGTLYTCKSLFSMNHQKSPIKWKFIFLLEPFWLMELPVDWEGQICVGCCFLKTKTCRSLMKMNKRTGISGTVSQISLDNQKRIQRLRVSFSKRK